MRAGDTARNEILGRYDARVARALEACDFTALTTHHSLNAGLTGVAYALLCRYRISADARFLDGAAAVATYADDNFDDLSEPDECRPLRESPSLFHARPGLYLTAALVALERGDAPGVIRYCRRFAAAVAMPDESSDATIGSASALIGTSRLLRRVRDAVPAAVPPLTRAGGDLSGRLLDVLAAPLRASGHMPDLSFAHGAAGMLYALVDHHHVVASAPPAVVRERLDELAGFALPSALGGTSWPVTAAARAWGAASWCNGAAGPVWLWLAAHAAYRDARYAALAETTAFFVGQSVRSRNASVCCGLTGQALALFAVFSATGEQMWFDRGVELAELAAAHIGRHTWAPGDMSALYRGETGAALVFATLRARLVPTLPVIGD